LETTQLNENKTCCIGYGIVEKQSQIEIKHNNTFKSSRMNWTKAKLLTRVATEALKFCG